MNSEYRIMKFLFTLVIVITSFFTLHSALLTSVDAAYDPLSVPNNKYGIHIISPTSSEASYSAALINTNGDWGYVTLLIESKDRNEGKWQSFFNELRRRHLIPIVRLATKPDPQGFWERPYEGEETAWADFLDRLNWPTKNRYIIVYNEPNHAKEWGNSTDPRHYARVLDKTITALKNKSDDFFILNAGFDASTPHKPPVYFDQYEFMRQMNEEVPGIFNRLDGWSSHSYPNPGFIGRPYDTGRKSIRGFLWELEVLKEFGVTKNLPVFITETGWKHAEGKVYNKNLPTAEKVAEYYEEAFKSAWADKRIIAVTPFLLNYQDEPFSHFSFKKYTGENLDTKLLGIDSDTKEFYHQFYKIQSLPKTNGRPIQEDKMEVVKGAFYPSLVLNEKYELPVTVKNTGQSIWNDYVSQQITIRPIASDKLLTFEQIKIPISKRVEPGEEYKFTITVHSKNPGEQFIRFNLYAGDKKFKNSDFTYKVNVKSPVILKVKGGLAWKNDDSGSYILEIAGAVNKAISNLIIGENKESEQFEAKYLIPDVEYDFTLSKPFYKSKTIHQKVESGINELDFGELQPDIASAILNPKELLKLLPN